MGSVVDILQFGVVYDFGIFGYEFMVIVRVVYRFVWNFHYWYMGNEVGLLRFSKTYGIFIGGMALYLMGNLIVIVTR